jgi:hypothetical protein
MQERKRKKSWHSEMQLAARKKGDSPEIRPLAAAPPAGAESALAYVRGGGLAEQKAPRRESLTSPTVARGESSASVAPAASHPLCSGRDRPLAPPTRQLFIQITHTPNDRSTHFGRFTRKCSNYTQHTLRGVDKAR